MDNNKMQGIVSIIAAVGVLLLAMVDARVSLVLSFACLVGLGVWQLTVDSRMRGNDTKKNGNGANEVKLGREKLLREQAKEMEERMAKLREFVAGKDKVSNNEVQKLLGVSDATAERYLQELEKEEVLRQVEDTGRGVYYEKTK